MNSNCIFIGALVERDRIGGGRRGTVIEILGERARVNWTVQAPGEWGFKPVRTWVAFDDLKPVTRLNSPRYSEKEGVTAAEMQNPDGV